MCSRFNEIIIRKMKKMNNNFKILLFLFLLVISGCNNSIHRSLNFIENNSSDNFNCFKNKEIWYRGADSIGNQIVIINDGVDSSGYLVVIDKASKKLVTLRNLNSKNNKTIEASYKDSLIYIANEFLGYNVMFLKVDKYYNIYIRFESVDSPPTLMRIVQKSKIDRNRYFFEKTKWKNIIDNWYLTEW